MLDRPLRRKAGSPISAHPQMAPIHINLPPIVVEVLDDLAEATEYTRSALGICSGMRGKEQGAAGKKGIDASSSPRPEQ